jgi:hypothetical protein
VAMIVYLLKVSWSSWSEGSCELNKSYIYIISTDDDLNLRIEILVIMKIRGVSTDQNLWVYIFLLERLRL